MIKTRVHCAWRKASEFTHFASAISLHSHTLHSRESLEFIPGVCRNVPVLASVLNRGRESYRLAHGCELDFSRGWWTSPLSAHQALELESAQIEALGKRPIVSITDHDTIDAARMLSLADTSREPCTSVEWTVPFRSTFLHLGVHNLRAGEGAEMNAAMNDYTARPSEPRLLELLEWMAASPQTLIVLNHPAWDEKGIGFERHFCTVGAFLTVTRPFLHALEVNGLRCGKENRQVTALAEAWGLPAVSGGDRHGLEPNAVLNLTFAETFGEFAAEVRDGRSEILVMPQYRQAWKRRLYHQLCDILRRHEDHSLGQKLWLQRVFYRCEDGVVRSLAEAWERPPSVIQWVIRIAGLLHEHPVRSAVEAVLGGREELAG